MSRPAVSVLMTVHNGARFISDTLETLAAQSFRDMEFVIVDDASTDTTPRLLSQWQPGVPVTLIRNDDQAGVAASLNRGLAACHAALVARADADDSYHPQRIARQVAAMQGQMRSEPPPDVLSCAYRRLHADGSLGQVWTFPTQHAEIEFGLLFETHVLHPGVMFRRAPVEAVGGYDAGYWTAQDSELWLRLRGRVRFGNLAQPLVYYREHADKVTSKRGAAGERLSMSVKARGLSDYLDRNVDVEEATATVHFYQGYKPVNEDDMGRAERLLRQMRSQVYRREPAYVARLFDRRCRQALLRQAAFAGSSDPRRAASLAGRAFVRRPGFYAGKCFAKHAARTFMKRPA